MIPIQDGAIGIVIITIIVRVGLPGQIGPIARCGRGRPGQRRDRCPGQDKLLACEFNQLLFQMYL